MVHMKGDNIDVVTAGPDDCLHCTLTAVVESLLGVEKTADRASKITMALLQTLAEFMCSYMSNEAIRHSLPAVHKGLENEVQRCIESFPEVSSH